MASSTRTTRRFLAVTAGLATVLSGGLVAATTDTASAGTTTSQYGTLSAPDGVLPAANKCATYQYSYALTPPSGDWGLETFVTDPRGNVVASYAAIDGYSAGGNGASTTFTLCRNNTAPGVFKISAKLSTDDGKGNITYYEVDPATFTLVAPTRTRKHHAKHGKHATKNKKGAKAKGRRD